MEVSIPTWRAYTASISLPNGLDRVIFNFAKASLSVHRWCRESSHDMLAVEDVLRRTTEIFRWAIILANINLKRAVAQVISKPVARNISPTAILSLLHISPRACYCETSENVFGGK